MLLVLGGCVGREAPVVEVSCQAAAIVGGSLHANYLAMHPSDEASVCRIQIGSGDVEHTGHCSGTLVAADRVLTAAHCVEATAQLNVLFDAEGGESSRQHAAVVESIHTSRDLAVLRLVDGPATDRMPLSTVLARSDATAPVQAGTLVQIAGYGIDGVGGFLQRRFAVSSVRSVERDQFVIEAEGRSAACVGDSGGPALVRDAEGRVTVVGVLASGSTGCALSDVYERLDTVSAWLAQHGVSVADGQEPRADCSAIGARGRCFDDVVIFCDEGDQVRSLVCSDSTTCGFDSKAEGFRCVSPGDDPCAGVGDRGACEGDNKISCGDGTLTSAPCDQCNATCTYSTSTGKAICNARP